MKFRFGRRCAAPVYPLSGRYLTRLAILAVFCLTAVVVLSLPHLRDTLQPPDGVDNPSTGVVQTAMTPSPFGEIGMGVIVSDGRPKQLEQGPSVSRESVAPATSELPPVDMQLLHNVLDKTQELYQRPYYHLVTIAAQSDAGLMEQRARRDVTFAHLWTEPERYRGELVYLEGYLRGLRSLEPATNEFFNPARVATLYEGYLMTQDSQPNPYIIIVPRVPDGIPIRTNIIENVTFAGYFFKLWRYTAADKTERAAPLLIGQMLTWTPAPLHDRSSQLSMYLAAGFAALVLGMGSLVWLLNRRSRLSGRFAVGLRESPAAIRSELEALEKIEMRDPIEELERNVEERS